MTESTPAFKDMQLVVFRLGNEEFGADIAQIREIIRVGEITTIPQSPPDIDGVINLRGRITTVVNLRKRLGMADRAADSNARIVIAEIEGKTLGLIVDNVSEVKYIKGSQVEPIASVLASEQEHDFIQGVCKLKNNLLILVDLKKILDADASDDKNAALA